MSNPSKKTKTAATSGGPFAERPRFMLVRILGFFTMHEVARLQRLVCLEFRDAGQERIHERGGRSLYEEGMAFVYGLDYKTINKPRARLLLLASLDAGCTTALLRRQMRAPNRPESSPRIAPQAASATIAQRSTSARSRAWAGASTSSCFVCLHRATLARALINVNIRLVREAVGAAKPGGKQGIACMTYSIKSRPRSSYDLDIES